MLNSFIFDLSEDALPFFEQLSNAGVDPKFTKGMTLDEASSLICITINTLQSTVDAIKALHKKCSCANKGECNAN